jgi:hypothetical protein
VSSCSLIPACTTACATSASSAALQPLLGCAQPIFGTQQGSQHVLRLLAQVRQDGAFSLAATSPTVGAGVATSWR